MYHIQQRRFLIGLILAALTLGTGAVRADSHQHSPAAPSAGKTSAPVKKFATDESLRKGMEAIAALAGNQTAYKEAAGKIEAQIHAIEKNCKLDPKADTALHEIIADMNHALLLMRGAKLEVQKSGVLALKQALRNYGNYFDHPGWSVP